MIHNIWWKESWDDVLLRKAYLALHLIEESEQIVKKKVNNILNNYPQLKTPKKLHLTIEYFKEIYWDTINHLWEWIIFSM